MHTYIYTYVYIYVHKHVHTYTYKHIYIPTKLCGTVPGNNVNQSIHPDRKLRTHQSINAIKAQFVEP